MSISPVKVHQIQQGMTLMELVVALAVALVVLTAASGVMNAGTNSYGYGMRELQAEAQARTALDRLAGVLQHAVFTSMSPSATGPFPTSTLEFQIQRGFESGVPKLSHSMRICLETESTEIRDLIDNDGDGLVDENEVVWIEDLGLPTERRRVIISGIPEMGEGEIWNALDDNQNGMIDERGFAILIQANTLRVALTLVVPNPGNGKPLVRSLSTSILLRNR